MRNTEREAETQSQGEASSRRGARCGTRSRDPGIMTWAKGRCLTTEPPRCPCDALSTEVTWWHCTDRLVWWLPAGFTQMSVSLTQTAGRLGSAPSLAQVAAQGYKNKCSERVGQSCKVLHHPASEVLKHSFCHILLVKQIAEAAWIQGKGIRLTLIETSHKEFAVIFHPPLYELSHLLFTALLLFPFCSSINLIYLVTDS